MELYCSLILDFDQRCTGQVGDEEGCTPVYLESTLGYHSCLIGVLTCVHEAGRGTVSGRQFDWGGRLPKSNGGAQRYAQIGRKSIGECKCRSVLDCETNRSNRDESRD